MTVDTDVFEALTERAAAAGQVAAEVTALGRKVTHLSGRVTLLDTRVTGRLTDLTRIFGIFLGGPQDRPVPRHAAPKRDRHGMRLVGGERHVR